MYYDPSGYFCEGKGNSFWDSKWGQGIKAGGQILGGFGQIAAGVAVTKLSFGLATPIGGYMMLHGAGNVWSGFRDSIDIMRGNEVKLGQYNFVKNAYTGIGGWIGGEKGASIGEYMYYGVDIAVSLIGIGLEIKNIIKVWQRVPSGIKLTNIRFGMSEQLYKTVLSPYYHIRNLGIGSKVVPRVSKFIGFGINLFNDYTAIEGNKEEMSKIIKDYFNKTKENEQDEETEENNYFNNFKTILEMEY